MDTLLSAFVLVLAVDDMTRRWNSNSKKHPENPDDSLPPFRFPEADREETPAAAVSGEDRRAVDTILVT